MKKILALTLSLLLLTIIYTILLSSGEAFGVVIDRADAAMDLVKTEQSETPWFNEAWHYRRPLVISNNGSELSDYAVLIKLDESNFDFNHANIDGADIRVIGNDGITEMDYWIESWASAEPLAYLWVRVPTLASSETTLYLYYNNSSTNPVSDGKAVFIDPNFFEDNWDQFSVEGYTDVGPWFVLDGTPAVMSGTLELAENTGIKTLDWFHYKAVGYRANFGLGDGLEWGGFIDRAGGPRTMIRDLPDDVHNLFLQDYINLYEDNRLEPVGVNDWHDAYHVYEVRWQEGQSMGDVDHGTSSVESIFPSQVPTDTLPVTFYSFDSSNAILRVDWVYVRQYRDPEPMVMSGAEQGLVDLAIQSIGMPDSLYPGEELTYLLTITNTSSIDAPGVILTDTLPVGVLLASVEPQGICSLGVEVVCNLSTIPANSTVNITAVVTTTIDGLITNTVVVASPGYDLNMSDNTSQEVTTVLPFADLFVGMVDSPDPVRTAVTLTYTTTVFNNGPSLAADVILTDTLPVQFNLSSAVPGQGSCIEANPVRCDFGSIDSGTSIELVIQVIPASGGVFTNTAVVASSADDPDMNNNNASEETLVDGVKPTINWEAPVQDEGQFVTFGGTILLRVNADDNDQVDRVEFKLWDHIGIKWVDIGTAITSPYQVEFDGNMLARGTLYQMWAFAYDRAGNYSGSRIYIERLYPFYIPLLIK